MVELQNYQATLVIMLERYEKVKVLTLRLVGSIIKDKYSREYRNNVCIPISGLEPFLFKWEVTIVCFVKSPRTSSGWVSVIDPSDK